ncbi:MAG: 8-oxo-dGTP diphosphatase [Succinivibrio sp.]|nr:8-oxo-dGTP diphosphatase [Succinivibrio sp.]
MAIEKAELTTICYLEKDDCYLMLHRVKKDNDINKDKWIGIGGHIEDGESPDECIVRETLEETGLTLNSYSLRGLITFVSDCYGVVYMFLYTSDDFSGVMNSQCNEGELEWIKKDKLFDLPLWEGDKVFFHLLETRKDFFSLKLVYSKDTLRQCILDGECINHKELCSNKLTLKAQECKD